MRNKHDDETTHLASQHWIVNKKTSGSVQLNKLILNDDTLTGSLLYLYMLYKENQVKQIPALKSKKQFQIHWHYTRLELQRTLLFALHELSSSSDHKKSNGDTYNSIYKQRNFTEKGNDINTWFPITLRLSAFQTCNRVHYFIQKPWKSIHHGQHGTAIVCKHAFIKRTWNIPTLPSALVEKLGTRYRSGGDIL